jgi:hypothetical protein
VVALAIVGVVVLRTGRPARVSPTCTVTSDAGRLHLDVEQAANAATIAAVGKRDGLADHAVTVALVAALQESKLRNLAYGDLDSVGIFQQRPSQGWGSETQLVVPSYAAAAFYRALVRIPGWDSMPVGQAAQAVQRSAAPEAYAPWEHQARALADALTGETAAAFSCRFAPPTAELGPDSLADAVTAELGSPALGTPVAEARGWTVASWLVAHGSEYHLTSVSFMGRLWTPATGAWSPHAPVNPYVEFVRA